MSKKSIIGKILKAPLVILVSASFVASIYAAYNKIQGITYVVSVILGIILALYIIGLFLDKKESKE
jgi:membrane protein DedA with SNARE-associated domain